MNFLYLDPGLINNLGHNAFSCRHITTETRLRHIPTYILANNGIEADLKKELNAQSFFDCYTYITYTPNPDGKSDPICGWLHDFEIAWSRTRRDLDKIKGITSSDVIFLNTARAPQLMALWSWMSEMPIRQRPTSVVEFGGAMNATVENGKLTGVPHPMHDALPTLLRYIVKKFTDEDRSRIILTTFDPLSSKAYEALLEYPVRTLPLPHKPITDCHSRVGKRPITVSVIGQQTAHKGYHLVPDIAAGLLSSRDDIRLLIHNNLPHNLKEAHEKIRALAAKDPRVTIHEEFADRELWQHLLNQSDLMLCPYNATTYSTSYSAVTTEAIANAVPLVVPSDTSLSKLLGEFGHPGVTFDEFTAESVLKATHRALDDFDRLAATADAAASQWEKTKGASNLVDVILSFRSVPKN